MARTADKPAFPRSPRQLLAWLRDTEVGRRLFTKLLPDVLENRCRTCQRLRPYPKVLVVVRRLGPLPGVEVFHEQGITVRLEELLDTRDDKHIEILAEELLELQLPKSWRHLLHVPHRRTKSACFHAVTASRQIRMLHDSEELRIYREFGETNLDNTGRSFDV